MTRGLPRPMQGGVIRPHLHDRVGGAPGIRGQITRYVRSLAWVAGDALPRWPWRVLLIVACNLMGLLSMLAAIGGVMAFARAAERREAMRVLGRSMEIGSDLHTLLEVGTVITLLGFASAACMFIADRTVLALAKRYHTINAERAIALASDPRTRGWQVMAQESPRAIMVRLTGSGSRAMAFVLRDMLRIILPIFAIAGSILLLVYLDSTLTLALVPFAALYLLALYFINRRVMRMQRAYREHSPEARREVGDRLRGVLDVGHASAAGGSVIEGSAWSATLDGLYGRLLADRRVTLLNTAFFMTCLVGILLYYGVQAGDSRRAWADLIFYLLALRYAMAAIKQSSALVAKFSRFYPEYHFYSRFVAICEQARASQADPKTSLPEALAIRIGRHSRWNGQSTVRLRFPACLLVFVPTQPGYADMEAVMLRVQRRLAEPCDLANRATYVIDRHGVQALASPTHQLAVLSGFAASCPEYAQLIADHSDHLPNLIVIVDNDPARVMALPMPSQHAICALVIEEYRIVAGGNMRWLKQHIDDITSSLQKQAEKLRRRGSTGNVQDDDDEADQ